jgi:HSP20 family protein
MTDAEEVQEMFGSLTNFEGNLLDDLRRMQRELEGSFGRSPWPAGIRSVARDTYPPINVGVTAERVDVYLFVAGANAADIDISIQQNLLTVAGERKAPLHEGAHYYSRERFSGQFRRVIALPEDVDPDKVDASYRDGVLQISVHRRKAVQPRRIEIR